MCKEKRLMMSPPMSLGGTTLFEGAFVFLESTVTGIDQEPPEKTAERRIPFEKRIFSRPARELFKLGIELRIGLDDVVETLTDAPAILGRLPVDLLRSQSAERRLSIVSDLL
jgi:hypothetical protein